MNLKTITFLFVLAFSAACTNKTETAAAKTNDQPVAEDMTETTTVGKTVVEDNMTTERNEVSPVDVKEKEQASTPEKLTVKPEKKIKKLGGELTGKKWLMTKLIAKTVKGLKKPYSIEFKIDNTFAAFAGCNSIGGSYKLKGESISFTDVMSTKMACAEMNDENIFIQNLKHVDSYRIENGELQLMQGSNIVARFR